MLFRDEHTARRAIAGRGRPVSEVGPGLVAPPAGPEPMAMEEDGDGDGAAAAASSTAAAGPVVPPPEGPLDPCNPAHMAYWWHKGPDYVKPGVGPVPLIFRMATIEDVKDFEAPRR